MLMLITVIILVIIVICLMMYNISIHKKLQVFGNLNQKVNSLNVLQEFMNTISESNMSADEKIRKINEILIDRYEIKYSTIVIYDGAEYTVKVSNVDEKHWDALKSLYKEEIFKDSIQTATPKYITVNGENERLPYQKMEFGRAKSAIFFPLYVDNVYIGYWIIEGSIPHEFDNVDTTILEVVKENIVGVIKTLEKQNVIENIVRTDKFTVLPSEEYLYGEGKKIIDKYTTSTVCMFKIINIEYINDELGREYGNDTIKEIAKTVRENISPEYIFVRYMGPKFVIVYSGVSVESVANFMEEIKNKIESIEISDGEETINPKVNIVLTEYYKGTALEGTTKKLEEYLDNADKKECDITQM